MYCMYVNMEVTVGDQKCYKLVQYLLSQTASLQVFTSVSLLMSLALMQAFHCIPTRWHQETMRIFKTLIILKS
jgi:hypothetical protein